MSNGFTARWLAVMIIGTCGWGSLLAGDKSKFDWKKIEATDDSGATSLADQWPMNERAVWMQAICVRVPVGFCGDVGLADGPSIRSLSLLEKRLLLNALNSAPTAELVSNPQLVTPNGETPRVKIGDELELKLKPVCSADGTNVTLHIDSVASGHRLSKELDLLPIGTALIMEKGKSGKSEVLWIVTLHAIQGRRP
jgi:hypothetical protein